MTTNNDARTKTIHEQSQEPRSIEKLVNKPVPYAEMSEEELKLVIEYKAQIRFNDLKNDYEYGLAHYALLQEADRHSRACEESNEVLFNLVEQSKLNNDLSKDLFKDLN